MVNVMGGIEGINIWANFTYDETTSKVVCEFRSRGMSIVDIAKNMVVEVTTKHVVLQLILLMWP